MRTINIYSRSDCHLCEQAHAIVYSLQETFGYEMRVIDIDQDRELVGRYGTSIPVLSIDGEDVLTWPFTRAQAFGVLQQRLASRR